VNSRIAISDVHIRELLSDAPCGTAIIQELDKGIAKNGSILEFLFSITEAVDDMGGTLGAIFGILLSAFASALKQLVSERGSAPDQTTFALALAKAVEALKSHTGAREGDRTVMDVLLPFTDAFAETSDFFAAVQVAKDKAEATRFLKAKFGRATYVPEAQGQELPDPGAWALFEMVDGMAKGIKEYKS
jgi:triose/dihydroxyacetone kinase / FAD-AMP lyase (cyclizing)